MTRRHNLGDDIGLDEVFQQNSDRTWLFVRPGGNWGDHLIYAGAEALARSRGLSYVTVEKCEFNNAIAGRFSYIYLHGSGGYNSWCSGVPFDHLAIAASSNADLVVQGPQTCEAAVGEMRRRLTTSLAYRQCRKLVMFAREVTSYRVLSATGIAGRGVYLALDDDTALHLAYADLLRLAAVSRPLQTRYQLTVCRWDNEKAPKNNDARPIDQGLALDPAYFARSFQHWLRIHMRAKSLVTDRLHSAIVGSLLNKPLTLCPGSYHKNHSVWLYSLKQRGVLWRDEPITLDIPGPAWVPRWLRRSYKVQKILPYLYTVPLA